MARRWADPSAFRADPNAESADRPSWRQSIALIAVLVVVAGAIAAVSYAVRPDRARSFQLLHGSLLIGDQFGPVSVDLASGHGTLQIRGAAQQAGVKAAGDLQLVPFDGGTMLLNQATGEFNMVDTTGFLVKRNGGVSIPGQSGDTTATGIAAGQLAYIERTGSSGTDVLLVGPSTVATAAANPKSVKARASYAASDQGVTTPGGAASANGDLWALFRKNGKDVVRQLSLPANSSTGVALTSADRATVDQLSVIESATASADGSGNDVVGVASPGAVRIFAPGQSARTVGFKAPAGLDQILPATSSRGRLSYLLHGSAGWYLLSVDTAGGDVAGPVALHTIAPDADLAWPAESLGSLYTMPRTGRTETVYKIEPDGKVSAVAQYPQKTGKNGASLENASFNDAYLVARDSRVVVDSPGHYLALAVFTDGSHAPRVIEKTNLTSVNAANGADALTQGPVDAAKTPTKSGGKVAKAPPPQINNKINCKQVNQKPHVPQIATADPAARSVGLSWVYPVVDQQDCLPSTYVVTVKLLSNNAPPAPGRVTLQDHTDTIIGGLYPSTQYEFTVTAYINGQSTPSQPIRVTTGKEGPAAPTGISVSPDASGNWDLSWSGCGSVAKKCVPVDSWSVKPSFCDGDGLSASPAAVSAPADSSSVKQPAFVYNGSDTLLGHGLRFQIQGSGTDGTPGALSASSACVYSYSPPIAKDLTLSASKPSDTALGGQATTNVSLDLGSDPTRSVGGVGSRVTLKLTGNGGTQTKSFTVRGTESAISADFSNIRAGADYQASATVTTAHGGRSVSIPAVLVHARANWPDLGLKASCAPATLACNLDVQITGLASSQANNEQFKVDGNRSYIVCGGNDPSSGTTHYFDDAGFDPAQHDLTASLGQLSGYYGTCHVQVVLLEDSSAQQLVFGGTASRPADTDVNLGAPQTGGAGGGDFSAAWDGGQAVITYTGSNALIGALTTNWNETLYSPNNRACGTNTSNSAPTSGQAHRITADADCVNREGANGGWTVKITYDNTILGGHNGPFTATISGAPPTYQPCTVAQTDFTVTWEATPAVQVQFTGNTNAIPGCSAWQYTLLDQNGASCGSPDGPSDPHQTVEIKQSGCTTPPADGWHVQIKYNNTAGDPQTALMPAVGGKPPGS